MRRVDHEQSVIAKAVREWYRHYDVEWDDSASSFLCDAAIELYDGGCRSLENMATILIGNYVGLAATRVNAPTSDAVH